MQHTDTLLQPDHLSAPSSPAAAALVCFSACPSHDTPSNTAPQILPQGAACCRSGVAFKHMHSPRSNLAAQPALPRAADLAFPGACMRSLSSRRCWWACLRRQRSCLLQLSSSACTFMVRSLPCLFGWQPTPHTPAFALTPVPQAEVSCLSVQASDVCGLGLQSKPHVALLAQPPVQSADICFHVLTPTLLLCSSGAPPLCSLPDALCAWRLCTHRLLLHEDKHISSLCCSLGAPVPAARLWSTTGCPCFNAGTRLSKLVSLWQL